jgi:hypothetical protein
MEKTKNKVLFVFFEWLWSIKVAKKQKNHLGTTKNPLSQKQTFSQKFCFLVLLEFFVFFVCLLIHMIAICVSWEVKLWPKFLTQELKHYVRLSLA